MALHNKFLHIMILMAFTVAANAQDNSGTYENEIIKRQREIWKQRTEGTIVVTKPKKTTTTSGTSTTKRNGTSTETSSTEAQKEETQKPTVVKRNGKTVSYFDPDFLDAVDDTKQTTSTKKATKSNTASTRTSTKTTTTTKTTTPSASKKDDTPASQESQRNNNVAIEKMPLAVFFGVSSSAISESQQYNIKVIADYLQAHPDSKVSLKGYASTDGRAKANKALSLQRAQAVKNALTGKYHIAANRIRVSGRGASNSLFQIRESHRATLMYIIR